MWESLSAGRIDLAKARVFSDWLVNLADEHVQTIAARVLVEAPGLTTAEIVDRIKREAIAIDPDWARRKYEDQIKHRRVVKSVNPDGTANLSGYDLPLDEAATAKANVDRLAKSAKSAGDPRGMDAIRADLFLGLLEGRYQHQTDAQIITDLLHRATTRPDDPDDTADNDTAVSKGDDPAERHTPVRDTRAPRVAHEDEPDDNLVPEDQVRPDHDPDAEAQMEARPGTPPEPPPGTTSPIHTPPGPRSRSRARPQSRSRSRARVRAQTKARPQARPEARPQARPRVGVEVRVRLSTLLGYDDLPGDVPGWAPVHAHLALRMAADQVRGEWRYAIVDDAGCLIDEGITRARPTGWTTDARPCAGGIVEIAVPQDLLNELAADPDAASPWAPVITDLAHRTDDDHNDIARRFPRAGLRRHTQIRDRRCGAPGCRAPAHATEADHIHAYAAGGVTSAANLQSLCRHDHRLKDAGGWHVARAGDGGHTWTSPNTATRYHVPPRPILYNLPRPRSATRQERGAGGPQTGEAAQPAA
ncbi:MAG: hypothetical protein GEV11_26365 [Streptosporangiales bacterium]|nr:hypothetical protein [Streptosporangiales bacterium]